MRSRPGNLVLPIYIGWFLREMGYAFLGFSVIHHTQSDFLAALRHDFMSVCWDIRPRKIDIKGLRWPITNSNREIQPCDDSSPRSWRCWYWPWPLPRLLP